MTPGFYGKLPSKGDFVQRGVSPGFANAWDSWLQTSIEHSRAKLGEAWLNTYLVSPIWRFCLAPNLLSQNAMAGVVMPSVDSVGRYFPLTLVAEIPPGQDLVVFAQHQDEWFSKLEQLALYSLSKDFVFAYFEQYLEEARVRLKPHQVRALPQGERRTGWLAEGDKGADVVASANSVFINKHILEAMQGFSLWWTVGSDAVSPTFMIYQGLPSVEDYASFINGEW